MSEQPRHNLPKALPGIDKDASLTGLYRIAYDEARSSISDQVDELNGMRNRAVSFMAFIGSATAFLVGTSVGSATPSWLFYVLAVLAGGSTIYAIVQLCRVIRPGIMFTIRLDPTKIIADFIDRQVPRPSEAQLLRSLTGFYGVYIDQNEEGLSKIRNRFSQVIFFGSGGLLLWTLTVWIFAKVGTGA